MASREFEGIYNKGLAQCSKVSAAKQEYLEAIQAVQRASDEIAEEWLGDAGSACTEWLSNILSEINQLSFRADSLYSSMLAQAEEVRTEWPADVEGITEEWEERKY